MVEVVIGRVGRPHGVHGDVTVHSLTDEPTRRFVPGAVLEAEGRPLEVVGVRRHGDKLVVAFDGVDDRDAAAALTGTVLALQVPDDEETGEDDAWYDHQLVGLDVRLRSAIGSTSTDTATTDPATTDPATTDPATTDPATTDPAADPGELSAPVGTVVRVDHGAAQDLLVVRIEGVEHLVPFVTAIVPTVDVAAGYLVLEPPGGLLGDPEAADGSDAPTTGDG